MKITLAMCLLLGVGYVLVLRGVSALAGPNGGQAETLTLDGRVVGAANVGQQFTDGQYLIGFDGVTPDPTYTIDGTLALVSASTQAETVDSAVAWVAKTSAYSPNCSNTVTK